MNVNGYEFFFWFFVPLMALIIGLTLGAVLREWSMEKEERHREAEAEAQLYLQRMEANHAPRFRQRARDADETRKARNSQARVYPKNPR